MHPYISQAVAAERSADAIRAAEASRRVREARQAVAGRTHQSHRARRAARRQPSAAGLAVSGQSCR